MTDLRDQDHAHDPHGHHGHHDHHGHHGPRGHDPGRATRVRRSITGVLLAAIGGSMVAVAVTGDSRFYVREFMDLPLIVTGGLVVLLGVASIAGVVVPAHAPRSLALVGVAAIVILVVRPGPLSVDAGLRYDVVSGERVQASFEIPPESLVGVDADPAEIREHAVELHAAQIHFAVDQLPEQFDEVAIRMVGQFDVDEDGDASLVRFRIMCCAADAVRLTTPLDLDGVTDGPTTFERGTWVELWGQWDGNVDTPLIEVSVIGEIAAPERPYLTLSDL